MAKQAISILLIVILSLSLLPLTGYTPALAEPQDHKLVGPDLTKISPELRAILYEGKSVDGLALMGDAVKGKVIVEAEGLRDVLKYVDAYLVSPKIDNRYIVFGFYKLSDIESLATIPSVSLILPDFYPSVGLADIPEPDISPDDIGMNLYKMRDLLGVIDVENEFGYTGEGVTVAVIDTGVDFGQPNLQHALMHDEEGNPLVFDSDAMGIIYPFYNFTAVDGYLPTANLTVWIYDGFILWWDILEGLDYFLGIYYTIPADFYVGGIVSQSGVYKLGFQVNYAYGYIVPVLFVDSQVAGVYDTVYIDVTSVYKSVFLGLAPDYDFTDETAYTKGDIVIEDYTGDGIPDISLGVIGGFFLDSIGYFGSGFQNGFSETGNHLLIYYDFYGHGTAVASTIASDGSTTYDIYGDGTEYSLPGIARDAKILGLNGLFNGFVEAAWFYAAGFDTIVIDGVPFLYFTGEVRADLTSNSWGISYAFYDIFTLGVDFVSLLEMAFMIPGFLDPDYPGMLMVHAAGNGGPGFGTMTSSGAANLVLTIGASTSFHWVRIQTGSPLFFDAEEGFADNTIFWSARGPTPLGDVKPDVINVGAFGIVPLMIASGGGDGSYAVGFFGGTSMATPLTSGVAALIIQALRENGIQNEPTLIKQIIMNTAKDINYPAFLQGAGRVDAYSAISLIVNGGIGAYTSDTWFNLYEQMFVPWLLMWGVPPPIEPLRYGSSFGGYLFPDTVTAGLLTLENYYDVDVNVNINDYYLKKIGVVEWNFDSFINTTYGVVFMEVFDPAEFMDADFIMINLIFDYAYFDPYNQYWYSMYQALVFGEWNDINGNGILEDGEFYRMNYAYARANVQELTLNDPYEMMMDPVNNKLVLYVYRVGLQGVSVPTTIKMVKYAKTDSPYINTANNVLIPAMGSVDVPYNINVPADANPGIYSSFIEVTSELGDHIIFPVSWSVLYEVTGYSFELGGIDPSDETPYDIYSTMGRQQWGWRYESGDWRYIHFYVPPSIFGVSEMEVMLEWQHPDSGYDFAIHSPASMLIGLSDWGFYVGAGRTLWHSTYNLTALVGWAYPSIDAYLDDWGIYTLSIRQYQYGGLYPAESYKVKVEMTPAMYLYVPTIIGHSSFTIEASEDDPFYSTLYLIGVPSVSIAIFGDLEIYVIPSEFPMYSYEDMLTTIVAFSPYGTPGDIARVNVMGYREQTIILRVYNFYFTMMGLRLNVYETFVFS